MILGIDTATAATAAAVWSPGFEAEARDDPGWVGTVSRPRHATRLLTLVEQVLAEAGGWPGIERIAVGVGPGGFTGLRHGISTARALAQARGIPVTGVSSLEALARGADASHVYAVIDARRGEVFAAAWRDGEPLLGPVAIAPDELAKRLQAGALAVGDGAVRFREQLERAGAAVPEDRSPSHRVSAVQICRIGAEGGTAEDLPLPDYRREPDASPRSP